MSSISEHVGKKIRKMRKSKGYTTDEFSRMINKSKATLSKYENGIITIDIETLLDISDALETDIKNLIDYQSPNVKPVALPHSSFFNQPRYFVYYYDGRIKKVVRALLLISRPAEDVEEFDAAMYMGLPDFSDVEKAEHIFSGKMKPFDTLTHVTLINQVNNTEMLYMCLLNPLHAHAPALGLISGIASRPFFAPISFKVICSKQQLIEDGLFRSVLEFSKEDMRNFRHYNMLLVNRPNALFLNEK